MASNPRIEVRPRTSWEKVPQAGRIVIFSLVYAAAYWFSSTFSASSPAPFWAPDAVLLAVLLLSPRKTWWIYAALSLPIRLAISLSAFPGPLAFLLSTTANDALKGLLAAAVLRHRKPEGKWLSSPRDFAEFVAVAVIASPALSAVAGAASRGAFGADFWPVWATWFLGDAVACLVLAPSLLSLGTEFPRLRLRPWRGTIEAALLAVGLVVSGAFAFNGTDLARPSTAMLMCIPFPFLLWAAARFRVRGTSVSLSVLAATALWALSHTQYVLTPEALHVNVLSLQLFLLVVAASLMSLAVVLEEQEGTSASLRATQGRLALAEATSMIMVVHVELDGRWSKVPRRLADRLGLDRRRMLETSSFELTHPEDAARERLDSDRLLAGQILSFDLEKRYRRSDGGFVWFYLSRSLVSGSDGQPAHFLDHLIDIDERKRAEEDVRRSENQLRLFAEQSPAAVAMLDNEQRFVVTSQRFRMDFHFDGTVGVGRRYDEVLAAFPAAWPGALQGSLEGAVQVREDDTFTRPNGSIESLRWQIMPWTQPGGLPAGSILLAELTTDRKREERALEEHRRELAHLTRVSTLGELSGALAHELNQPLAAILANAQAAQRYISRGPAGITEVASILDDIVADDLRAGDVIRSLRKLLRNEDVGFQPVDFNEVIGEVLDLAQGDLIARNVSVHRNLDTDLPPVHGDRVQLQQVMLNLIMNACEAMAAEESPERRLRILTSREDGSGVRVTVQDTGPGVPPDIRERVFDPFLTTKKQGLGLGLSICRSLVTAHGGRLWLSDNEAGGASFHFVLPGPDA
jgi:PAS domain S-box-containing protein